MESYTIAATSPYTRDPMGMFVIRMLWLTPTLPGPKSSDVTETAAANMKPELSPISAVPTCITWQFPPTALRRANAIGVGRRAMANHPVLGK